MVAMTIMVIDNNVQVTVHSSLLLSFVHVILLSIQFKQKRRAKWLANKTIHETLFLIPSSSSYTTQNSLLSPILHVSNAPGSRPFHSAASLSNRGGSSTSSSVRTHVPQWIPIARLHFVSAKMLTLS